MCTLNVMMKHQVCPFQIICFVFFLEIKIVLIFALKCHSKKLNGVCYIEVDSFGYYFSCY